MLTKYRSTRRSYCRGVSRDGGGTHLAIGMGKGSGADEGQWLFHVALHKPRVPAVTQIPQLRGVKSGIQGYHGHLFPMAASTGVAREARIRSTRYGMVECRVFRVFPRTKERPKVVPGVKRCSLPRTKVRSK